MLDRLPSALRSYGEQAKALAKRSNIVCQTFRMSRKTFLPFGHNIALQTFLPAPGNF